MQDRVPTYPGRVKLTPVPGQDGFYDMERADEPTQAGTPLNKANLLTDATAAAYGLDENATPEGVFDFLSFLPPYTGYWWKRYRLIPIETPIAGSTQKIGSENARNFQYSASASVVNGEIVLDDPQSITVSSNMPTAASQLAALAPCYLKNASSAYTKYVYLPTGSTGGDSSIYTVAGGASGIQLYKSAVPAASIIAIVVSEEFDFVHSQNRNAYPDADDDGNYFYVFQGKPFENLQNPTKIVRGSYTGTGEYGSEHPNTLTFPFVPYIVIVSGQYGHAIFTNDEVAYGVKDSGYIVEHSVNLSANTLKWYVVRERSGSVTYTADQYSQLNASGITYHYIAI